MIELPGRRTQGHVDLLLLAALAEGPKHGYAIARHLDEHSGGRFAIQEGTLYPALHRLEVDGLVASERTTVAGRQRRVYTLTANGSAALASRRREWEQYAAGITGVLGEAAP
ncbi:MAG TPA: helix-turn-helix transcriptional regulator [Ilumatobacter sp.]|nr:helix-turn-helix transcriptional regulator [Ilumatobacter sp.]